MAFSLPQLPYAFDALEPHIDAQTMQIHHGKHHNTYVTNLNAAIEKAPELQSQSIEQLLANVGSAPEAVRGVAVASAAASAPASTAAGTAASTAATTR